MAKEALFNILNNLVDYDVLDVLDLFAGTGNISFEFASRGSNSVTAVDISHKCIRFIQQVAQKLNYDQLKTAHVDFKKYLNRSNRKWDLIFADPPYAMENTPAIYELVFQNNLLKAGGLLVIEHDDHYDFSAFKGFYDHRKYGKVNFSFFQQQLQP